jgi:hypothetical protein
VAATRLYNPSMLPTFTDKPPTVALAVPAQPEFADSKQVKLLFGLSRSHVYSLLQQGLIRSACLRRKGASRGRRLFDVSSIRSFIDAHVEPRNDHGSEAGLHTTNAD